jgi:diguanylate cyclase (GGDEF)-like protein
MSELGVTVLGTFIAQAVAGAILALLLGRFYAHYNRGYLAHWSKSWWSLAIFHAAGAAGFYLSSRYAATHPLRISLSMIAAAAAYLQIGWLLFGAYELAYRRPVRLATERIVLIALAIVGMSTVFLFIATPDGSVKRYFVRIGVRALLAGIAYLIAAVAVMRARADRRDLGFLIISIAFAIYGLGQLQYFAYAALWLYFGHSIDFSVYLGFADLVIQGMMGLGMLTCLLEDERQAALLASNEIEHLAYHDALTGLPNRPLFIDRLFVAINVAERQKARMAVFFCDLDRFKEINDSLGHSVGDELLKTVSQRIRNCVRTEDTVARFGGDEFTLILQRIEKVDDAAKIAQKILETMKIPFRVGELELFVSMSIGVALFPSDGRDAETLVKNADTAMYRAKEQGRDNFQIYAPAMNAKALEKLALENMLRKALAQEELVVYYQPLINVKTGRITGLEALIRWHHPELGLLSPAHFISTAEVSGLIVPIGEWVLRNACKQAKLWHRKYGTQMTVSVNLSARQFQQPDLVDQVRAALREAGLPPEMLELEITESSAMQNAENAIHTLRELKALGVKISMDDFGTGYSSLSYLKRFPIDTLKLDRSFVQDLSVDPEDEAIATAVIAMAHSMNLHVIAEGVETEAQLSFLRERHCDTVQGFFFSPPLHPEKFEEFVSDKREMLHGTVVAGAVARDSEK